MPTETDIQKDIEFIKKEIAEIKENMVDVDSIMTEDDFEAIAIARKEKKLGELTSIEKKAYFKNRKIKRQSCSKRCKNN